MTMRSLYEPLLVDLDATMTGSELFDAQDFRSRSYMALAGYLLSGERQVGGRQRLPDSLPEPLAAYLGACTARGNQAGETPPPAEFLLEFQKHAVITEGERARGGLALPPRTGAARETVTTEPMESAGSVSDFDEDNVDIADESVAGVDAEAASPAPPNGQAPSTAQAAFRFFKAPRRMH
jgi:hypothetical protein